jgi:hypothetical protein
MTDETHKSPPHGASQNRKRGEKIGQQLRKLYDDVTHETIPDDFFRLLDEADRASNKSDGSKEG